jgi:hypothetical protein
MVLSEPKEIRQHCPAEPGHSQHSCALLVRVFGVAQGLLSPASFVCPPSAAAAVLSPKLPMMSKKGVVTMKKSLLSEVLQ